MRLYRADVWSRDVFEANARTILEGIVFVGSDVAGMQERPATWATMFAVRARMPAVAVMVVGDGDGVVLVLHDAMLRAQRSCNLEPGTVIR